MFILTDSSLLFIALLVIACAFLGIILLFGLLIWRSTNRSNNSIPQIFSTSIQQTQLPATLLAPNRISCINVSDWVTFLSSEKYGVINNVISFSSLAVALMGIILVTSSNYWMELAGVVLFGIFVVNTLLFGTVNRFSQNGKLAADILKRIMSGELTNVEIIQKEWIDGTTKIKERHMRSSKGNPLRRLWNETKDAGESIGMIFMILGVIVLVVDFFLTAFKIKTPDWGLMGAALGLISVGLGFMAIGMSTQSDKKYTNILTKIDTNLNRVLSYVEPTDILDIPTGSLGNVIIAAPTAQATTTAYPPKVEITADASKDKAQARLDADTKKVGFVRGELFQKEDNGWAIHWGGKYPL